MGSVRLGTGGSYWFRGDHITQTAYCLYCDRCGSFKIGSRLTLKNLMWISIAALIATAFTLRVKNAIWFGSWLICFIPLLLFMAPIGILELGHRCKKCRNRHITMGNPRDYPENDKSILDVPYESAEKYYIDDY